jgi:hypothetical protein
LQRYAASTGNVDPRLIAPPIHPCCHNIWELFIILAASRQSGMGANPLALVDIEAYCRLANITLTAFELDTLLMIDHAALSIASKKQSK